MTKPAIRVLKQPPRPMGVSPVRGGVLQARLVAEQGRINPEPVGEVSGTADPVFPETGYGNDGTSRQGWVEAPLEPTEAMIAAGSNFLRGLTEGIAEIEDHIAKTVYTDMVAARFDQSPVDTQALFGASSSEIKAALTLYRKMKAPKKRKAKDG